jgi:hypothetical protein
LPVRWSSNQPRRATPDRDILAPIIEAITAVSRDASGLLKLTWVRAFPTSGSRSLEQLADGLAGPFTSRRAAVVKALALLGPAPPA